MSDIVRTYEDLRVWKDAMRLVKIVYKVTDSFPDKEKYRLIDQLCRAAISVPANIAEDSARRSTKDYIRFVNIAYSSLMECETHMRIASDIGYVTPPSLTEFLTLTLSIRKQLNALYSALKDRLRDNPKYQIPTTKYLEPEPV